jgi:hypothetical protein
MGLVFVTLGTLWTLDNLQILDASTILRWWPALLVLYGLARLTGIGARRTPIAGALFAGAGSWMLLGVMGVVHHSLWSLWPLFLILLGMTIVMRAMRSPGSGEVGPDGASDASPYPRALAFMAGVTRRVQSQQLRGAEVTAVMGGIELDLRGARAQEREVVVDVFAMWGGIEVYVPEDWIVACEVTPIMGGVEEITRPVAAGATTTLVIRGMVVMGGIEIRNEEAGRRRVRMGVMYPGDALRESRRADDAAGRGRTEDRKD